MLEPLHLNFLLLFFLQVGKWIVKANVGDFMRFIEPKQLVHLRMDKNQIWPSFAHGVDHQELFWNLLGKDTNQFTKTVPQLCWETRFSAILDYDNGVNTPLI